MNILTALSFHLSRCRSKNPVPHFVEKLLWASKSKMPQYNLLITKSIFCIHWRFKSILKNTILSKTLQNIGVIRCLEKPSMPEHVPENCPRWISATQPPVLTHFVWNLVELFAFMLRTPVSQACLLHIFYWAAFGSVRQIILLFALKKATGLLTERHHGLPPRWPLPAPLPLQTLSPITAPAPSLSSFLPVPFR